MVASFHSSVRRGETLAAILQVPLMLHLPPHGRVPVVLDGVVRPVREKISLAIICFVTQTGNEDMQCVHETVLPSRKKLGDLCPAVAKPFVGLVDDSVLFLCP